LLFRREQQAQREIGHGDTAGRLQEWSILQCAIGIEAGQPFFSCVRRNYLVGLAFLAAALGVPTIEAALFTVPDTAGRSGRACPEPALAENLGGSVSR